MDDYIVELIARLNTSKISTDINKIEKELEKNGINIKTVLDTAATKQELKNLAGQMQNVFKQNGIDINIGAITSALNRANNQVKSLAKEADDLKIDNAVVRLNEQLRKNTAYSKDAKKQISGWVSELSQGSVTEARLKEINSEAKKLHSNMASMGNIGLSGWDKFTQAWEKFGGWSIATGSFMKLWGEFKEGVQFIYDLDDALTDVAYTSDVSEKQLENLGNSAIVMAKDLNTSANNILEAVKIYSTANATADDILRKSQPAIILSNVSGMSGAESSKMINTALNQFELEDTEKGLMDIVDTLEYVSSQLNYDFTDGMKEITEGLEAAGSVANNAGLSLQEYAAMVGIGVEKTGQSGSTIGNAYKTIFSRTTRASATEGTMAEDISAAEKALRSVGIEVRDTEDEFRDFTDVMHDIGEIWDSLSSVEKSNLGFQLAGTRQLNVLNSLFGAWEDYEAIMANIDDRAGTAMENQEEYADSLKGHLGDLAATGQSIWNNLIDSEALKTGIDLLNGLLSVVDNLTSVLGPLGTIGLGAGIFAGIKNIGMCTSVHNQTYLLF